MASGGNMAAGGHSDFEAHRLIDELLLLVKIGPGSAVTSDHLKELLLTDISCPIQAQIHNTQLARLKLESSDPQRVEQIYEQLQALSSSSQASACVSLVAAVGQEESLKQLVVDHLPSDHDHKQGGGGSGQASNPPSTAQSSHKDKTRTEPLQLFNRSQGQKDTPPLPSAASAYFSDTAMPALSSGQRLDTFEVGSSPNPLMIKKPMASAAASAADQSMNGPGPQQQPPHFGYNPPQPQQPININHNALADHNHLHLPQNNSNTKNLPGAWQALGLTDLLNGVDLADDVDREVFDLGDGDGLLPPQALHSHLAGMTVAQQETQLVEDLLWVVQGVPGLSVQSSHSRSVDILAVHDYRVIQLNVHPAIHEALRQLTIILTPLVAAFTYANAFADKYVHSVSSGSSLLVMANRLQQVFYRYKQQIVNMQRQQHTLSLSDVDGQIGGIITKQIEIVADACILVHTNSLRGGALLNALYEMLRLSTNNEPKAQLTLRLVLNAVAQPFYDRVLKWMRYGQVVDCTGEFMICDRLSEGSVLIGQNGAGVEEESDFDEESVDPTIEPAKNWNLRFKLNEDLCPAFLKPFAHKIFKSGIYVNIITNDCQEQVRQQQLLTASQLCALPLPALHKTVESLFEHMSRQLLALLTSKYNITHILQFLNGVLLIGVGDWLADFLDSASHKLEASITDVDPESVYVLLMDSLEKSSMKDQPLVAHWLHTMRSGTAGAAPVSLIFSDHPLHKYLAEIIKIQGTEAVDEQLSLASKMTETDPSMCAFDGLMLMANVHQPPLHLLLTPLAKHHYAVLFRRLLHAKQAEFYLRKLWHASVTTSQVSHTDTLCMLCMRSFVSAYLSYCFHDVITPNHNALLKLNASSVSFDGLLEGMQLMLDQCMKSLMLTDGTLLCLVHDLLDLCCSFARGDRVPDVKVASHSHKQPAAHQSNKIRFSRQNVDAYSVLVEFHGLVDALVEQLPSVGDDNKQGGWLALTALLVALQEGVLLYYIQLAYGSMWLLRSKLDEDTLQRLIETHE